MVVQKRLQVVETYDSFRPDFLLSVNVRLADLKEPGYVKTCRSAYISLRHFTDGALTHLYQDELELDTKLDVKSGGSAGHFPNATYCNEVEDKESKIELEVESWQQSRQC
jgi:hypothetical protein